MSDAEGDSVDRRRALRRELIARREAMLPSAHRLASTAIRANLEACLADSAPGVLGFYWPHRRECDVTPVVRRRLAHGWRAALPVVVEKRKPLAFREWRPGAAMALGPLDIPFPIETEAVTPDVILIALVGFDATGYRLGYGAGYYDRTLADLTARGLAHTTIGVGFELGRVDTIFPHPHDIPMDVVVTEAGVFRPTQPP